MSKAFDFRSRAEQFRQLAAQFPTQEFRQIIFNMAAIWDNLADDRDRLMGQPASKNYAVDRANGTEHPEKAPENTMNKTAPEEPTLPLPTY